MQLIADVQQSKKELDFDSTMNVKVTRITPPEGRGYRKMASGRFEDMFKRHSGGHGSTFVQIKNNDWMCFARAVVVAKARTQYYNMGDKTVKWKTIKNGDSYRCTLQRMLALDLMFRAGLLGHKKRSRGYPEFKKIQDVMVQEGFQLKVFSYDHFDALIFDEGIAGCVPLYIYCHDDHYTPMSSPRILTGTNSYCDLCNHGYDREEDHNCPKYCYSCKKQSQCIDSENPVYCDTCCRKFKSRECFENHKVRPENIVKVGRKRRKTYGLSVCMRLKGCRVCGRTVGKSRLPPEKHKCGQRYCSTCKKWDENGKVHLCFMQPIKKARSGGKKKIENLDLLPEEIESDPDDLDAFIREEEDRQGETDSTRAEYFRKSGCQNTEVSKYLFWDFETIQEDVLKTKIVKDKEQKKEYSLGPVYLHKPNYAIVRKACMRCKDFWLSKCPNSDCKSHSCEDCEMNKPNCTTCKEHVKRFSGESCRDEFCDYLFREEHRGITAIAHNSKGFDAHFIIQWLVAHKRIPKIVPRGLQILSMESMGVRVIDSLAFLPQSLASMPKTFSEPELQKGYFPYLYCLRENWNKVLDSYPDADYYCPSQMKPNERNAFYKWYNEHKNEKFDFQEQLREYTESDCDILLRCVLKFNDLFHAETGIYPLENAITIAQACNQVFRELFLKENSIGVIPVGGYRGRERQSIVALEWIKWMSHKLNLPIQHARNGKEKVIGKYKVDGFFGSTVLEFNGCYHHGCLRCFKDCDKKIPNSSLTFEDAYQRTLEKAEFIRKSGYVLIEMWECDWKRQKQSDPDIIRFLNTLPYDQLLDPREALLGGRTNATVLWKKCKKGERIDYYDVCSLYPFVCKYCIFPLKHPKVLTENFKPIIKGSNPYFGLIRCKVLPPRKLLHPLLPYHFNGKLNFVLCKTCLMENNQDTCLHSDEQRSFTSTFVSVELDKALELGYQVLETYEVWHYEEKAEYDGYDESTGLFSSYINKFLKLKQQASGWPYWVKTEDDKEKFILDYEKKEGIKLEEDRIEKNPGLRAIAKLCLNSFWGKFAQRGDFDNVEFFSEPNEFFDTLYNAENTVSTVRSLGPDMVAVNYKTDEDFRKPNPNTSVVLASFVTARARLVLYSYIEKLQGRVLYFDTDSVIFHSTPGDKYWPPVGDHLGDLTDELSDYGENCYISEFVSAGPKQYSFVVRDPRTGQIVKTVTKVKGFSLNFSTSAHINFKRMRKQVKTHVLLKQKDEVAVYNPQISRMKNHQIVTEMTRKVQKVVYCKRVVKTDFNTVPFGY